MFSEKEENELMWEQFITESPWLTQPIPDKFTTDMESIPIQNIENLKYLGNTEGVDIYEDTGGKNFELYFVKNHELIAYYRYSKNPSGEIQIKMTWNSPKHKGAFLMMFGNYIIPRFKVVESDDMLTQPAFDMWKKLIGGYTQYNYYAKIGDRLTQLTSMHDVYDYQEGFGKTETPNSTFIASVNPIN